MTQRMTRSLNTEEAHRAGFVGQYLAQFPTAKTAWRGTSKAWKQLNLTAWESEQAAHDWYVHNEDHVEIVSMHRSGLLQSFACMLSQLTAPRPIAYQNRCPACAALVAGYPRNRHCGQCGAAVRPMPFF